MMRHKDYSGVALRPYGVRGLVSGAVVAAVVLGGCSSAPSEPETTASGLPNWIVTPSVDDGLAATGCVTASDTFRLDSNRADNAAREQLAATLGAQVESYVEDYQRAIETEEEGLTTGAVFEQITRTVVDEKLVGSRRVMADYVEMNGERRFCSLVAVGQEDVTEMLRAVAEAAEIEPDAFSNAEMREQFMSQEALNRLDQQVGN